MKHRIKICVDILMFLLFLYLLSYRPGMGLMYHAIVGIAQLSLFILHHVLNINWYWTMFRGKYTFQRIILTGSDFLLLIAMGFMIASSVMVSGMVFDFVDIRMTSWWRRIHVGASGWCFLLTAFHVGMHMQGMNRRLQQRMSRVPWLYRALQVTLVALGGWCFAISDLWPRVTLARRLPLLTFTSEEMFGIYLVIVIGMSTLVYRMLELEKHLKKKKEKPSC